MMLSPEKIAAGMERITGHAFEHALPNRVFVLLALHLRPGIPGRPFDMWVDGTPAAAGFVHVDDGKALVIDFDEEATGYNDLALYASRDEIAVALDKISLSLEAGIVHGFQDKTKSAKKLG